MPASVSWHAGARFPTGPRRPHGHAHVTCDAYFSFISFSLREPSHQTKAAATGTSDAAVLNQKLVWYCESEHACFVLFFFSIFFPTVSRKWQRLPFFLFFFSGFFLYFLLCVNSLDKDFRNIVLKNYIEHCAYKLYDELVRKKLSETSS